MTWTYKGEPGTIPRDHVRLLIGDTDCEDQLLSDGEILFFLDENGSAKSAAVAAAQAIAAKFSRLADEKVGQVSVTYSQKAEHYRNLADTLKTQLSVTRLAPYAGGISVSDKDLVESDTDRVNPAFTRTTHQNPEAPNVFEDEDDDDELGS